MNSNLIVDNAINEHAQDVGRFSVSLSMPSSLVSDLERIAEADGTSLGAILRSLARDFVADCFDRKAE